MKNVLATVGVILSFGLVLSVAMKLILKDLPSESYAEIRNESDSAVRNVGLSWLNEHCFVSSLNSSESLKCNLGGLGVGETALNIFYTHPTAGDVSEELYVAGMSDEFYEVKIEKNGKASVDWGLQTHNKSKQQGPSGGTH
jgi:hypothetical protein